LQGDQHSAGTGGQFQLSRELVQKKRRREQLGVSEARTKVAGAKSKLEILKRQRKNGEWGGTELADNDGSAGIVQPRNKKKI